MVAEAAPSIEALFTMIHTGRAVIVHPEAAHAPSDATITGAVAATVSAPTIVRMSGAIRVTPIREADGAHARMSATTGARGMRKRAITFGVGRRSEVVDVALRAHTFVAATS
jgi:hypothetical protein